MVIRGMWAPICAGLIACGGAPAQGATPGPVTLHVKSQSLRLAVQELGEQAGVQVLVRLAGRAAEDIQVAAVDGKLTVQEALDRMLANTGLVYEFINPNTIRISDASLPNGSERTFLAGQRLQLAQADTLKATSSSEAATEELTELTLRGIPEVMVVGKKSLNTDIERTQDDPQPYVVFNRETIERSGATSLNDFLMSRLPMNSSAIPAVATDINNGNTSSISLRGLGQGQTLILIDGRRAASSTNGFSSGQTDINGIPIDAIERIEVLPTTASAIYGGSATGGVINIIMRRDYVGTQASVTYDNSFDGDSSVKRYELSSGFTLFDGRTSFLVNGSYTDSSTLLNRQRDFSRRGRARILANSPGYNLPLGPGINVRSASGENLVLDGSTDLGSSITFAPEDYRGVAADGVGPLQSDAGNYDLRLERAGERNSRGITGSDAVLAGAGAPVKYFGGSLRHEFSDRIKAFVEISHSENRTRWGGRGVNLPGSIAADAPSNPFEQDIEIAWSTQQLAGYVESDSGYDRYGSGVIVTLPDQWVASLDYTLSKSQWRYRNSTPSFGDGSAFYDAVMSGAIDVLRDFDGQGVAVAQFLSNDFTLMQSTLEVATRNPALRLSGPVGSLPAGRPQLSLLLERQDSDFGTSTQRFGNGFIRHFPERSRKIDSAYLELRLPLLSSLELQLAGRWDRYASVNSAPVVFLPPAAAAPFEYIRHEAEQVSPLVAIRFQPSPDVSFRASYGEGFLPPDIGQLTASTVLPGDTGLSYLVDPQRGNTPITGLVDYAYGGNPDLKSETSTSWSAGVILTPRWLEGLRLSIDYTQIDKENNIVALDDQTMLDNEAFFAGRITRGANLPGDPAGWAGPITAFDNSYINAARTKLSAIDAQLDYELRTAQRGTFRFFAAATWQNTFDVRTTNISPVVDYIGWTSDGLSTALELRANAGVEWHTARWILGWSTRYASSYYVANPSASSSEDIFLAQGNAGRVPSQTYHDVFATYRFKRDGGSGVDRWLGGVELQAGIRNLFNKEPPFDVSSRYYYYSGLGDPRLATYYLTLKKQL